MFIAVGTFTDGFMGGHPSEGIHVFAFDPASRQADHVQTAGGVVSPSFLCRHPALPVIYSADRQWSVDDGSTGAVTTWQVDLASGKLTQAARIRSGGAFTAHVSTSPDGRIVAVANPLGPTIATFATDEAGLVREECAVVVHSGRGARDRQDAPWPHSTCFDRQGGRLLACDMGLDRIYLHDLAADGTLSAAPQPFAQVSSGAGCRHLALHPCGRFVYAVNELDCTLCAFAYAEDSGQMTIIQTLPTVPWDEVDTSQPAEVAIAPDGRYLYVTNRGAENMAVFAIDGQSGRLRLTGHVPTEGRMARHIALSPDGAFAFVSNQLSDEVAVFAIGADGLPQATGISLPVPSPSCCVVY